MSDLSRFNSAAVDRILGDLDADTRVALVATGVQQDGVTTVQAAVMVRVSDKWQLRGFIKDDSNSPLTAGAELRFAW